MDASGAERGFLALAPHCVLKRLETPALYDIRADALYELDEEGLRFLACGPRNDPAGRKPELAAFVDFCVEEGLLLLGGAVPRRPGQPQLTPACAISWCT
jgi:hypothetical protein